MSGWHSYYRSKKGHHYCHSLAQVDVIRVQDNWQRLLGFFCINQMYVYSCLLLKALVWNVHISCKYYTGNGFVGWLNPCLCLVSSYLLHVSPGLELDSCFVTSDTSLLMLVMLVLLLRRRLLHIYVLCSGWTATGMWLAARVIASLFFLTLLWYLSWMTCTFCWLVPFFRCLAMTLLLSRFSLVAVQLKLHSSICRKVLVLHSKQKNVSCKNVTNFCRVYK